MTAVSFVNKYPGLLESRHINAVPILVTVLGMLTEVRADNVNAELPIVTNPSLRMILVNLLQYEKAISFKLIMEDGNVIVESWLLKNAAPGITVSELGRLNVTVVNRLNEPAPIQPANAQVPILLSELGILTDTSPDIENA